MIYVNFHVHGPVGVAAKSLDSAGIFLKVLSPNEGETTIYFDTPKQFDDFCLGVADAHRKLNEVPVSAGTLTTDPAYDPFIEPAVQQASA